MLTGRYVYWFLASERRQLISHPQTLKSDEGAHWDRVVKISSSDISPTVSWGTSPQDVVAITGSVPDPKDALNEEKKAGIERALAYMGLTAGMKMEDVKIDKVRLPSRRPSASLSSVPSGASELR